jgi:hypothetical protein
MTDSSTPAASRWTAQRLFVLAFALGQAAFWIYTWKYVLDRINPKGGGMELMAVGPMTFIFLVLVLPGLVLAIRGLSLRAAIIFLLLGFAANFVVWSQIVSEFAANAAR